VAIPNPLWPRRSNWYCKSPHILETHPALEATRQEIEGAKAELLGSQGSFDPVLKAEYSGYPKSGYTGNYENIFVEQPLEWSGAKVIAGYRRGGGSFPIYEDFYNTNSNGEARAGLELPLLRDGPIDRRRASIARAFIQIEGAELSLEQRKVELARAAALSYWEWVATNQKLAAYNSLLLTAEQRDQQLAQRVLAGDLAKIDKTDNERQILQRRAQRIAAERSLRKSEFDLSLFLWSSSGQADAQGMRNAPKKVAPPPDSPDLRLSDDIEKALRLRAEHRRVKNNVQQQEVELDLAQNQILPRLDLQALASNDYGSGSSTREESELKAGVRIEIPLATRAQRGRIDALTAKKRELSAQQKLVEQKIAIEVADSFNAFTLAKARYKLAQEEVKVSIQLEKAEQSKFEQGESNLVVINIREQATVDAAVREIDALIDWWRGFINYRAAIGHTDFSS